MSNWFSGLNEQQAQAVAHTNGPLLILAGAGSGKTTVLVARTGRLIDEVGISPSRICVLTFTNKAARELKERLALRLKDKAKGLWAGTFHSFGLQFLKKHHELAKLPKKFGIIDASDAVAITKSLGDHINVGGKKDFAWDKVLSKMSDMRSGTVSSLQAQDEYSEIAEVLLPKYMERLQHLGVVDFDELLLKPIQILEDNPHICDEVREHFQHVMVDEFQDTNDMQMRLIRLITGSHSNIGVVGDDDQSIYGWRGAVVQNILQFPSNFKGCNTVRLEVNYRSTPQIINLANEVITKNSQRHEKSLKPSAAEGELPEMFVFESDEDESEGILREIQSSLRKGIKESEIAILYRSNGQSAPLEAELRKQNIAYKVSGGTAFFDRKEAKDLLAYLRCSIRPNEVSMRRILNYPTRGIGGVTIEKIESYAKSHDISFYKGTCRWKSADVSEVAGKSIDEFLAVLTSIPKRITSNEDSRSSGDIFLELVEQIGFKEQIRQECKKAEAFQKRWGFVEIFCRVMGRYVDKAGRTPKALREFVEAMELRDNVDEQEKKEEVQLMTLHASKGLEFPIVFLVGVEEDLLPHRSLGKDVSEERRLFYVGLTRAKKQLILSRARQRKRFGKLRPVAASRFISEIPDGFMKVYERGLRPLDEEGRKSQLSDLFAQLDSAAEGQRVK